MELIKVHKPNPTVTNNPNSICGAETICPKTSILTVTKSAKDKTTQEIPRVVLLYRSRRSSQARFDHNGASSSARIQSVAAFLRGFIGELSVGRTGFYVVPTPRSGPTEAAVRGARRGFPWHANSSAADTFSSLGNPAARKS